MAAAGVRTVPLIREWRTLMSEVGDHQSLVASLKQAQAYHVFKVHAKLQALSTLGLGSWAEFCSKPRKPLPALPTLPPKLTRACILG